MVSWGSEKNVGIKAAEHSGLESAKLIQVRSKTKQNAKKSFSEETLM